MTEFKHGDRVRVEYEGVISTRPNLSGQYRVTRDGDNHFALARPEHMTLIEPEYEVGAVYVSATGGLFYRQTRHDEPVWKYVASGQGYSEQSPKRPLRKLVPEVTS